MARIPTSRDQPEQIVEILREAEAEGSVKDTCRKHGVSEVTFHRWKRMYGGHPSSEVQRIKQLEKENRQSRLYRDWPGTRPWRTR